MIKMGGKKIETVATIAPQEPLHPVTYKSGGDDNRSRGDKPQEDAVQELLEGEPPQVVHQVPLQDGDHGIAAAEAANADNIAFVENVIRSGQNKRLTDALGNPLPN